ncbi:DNA glycosylase [Polychaeton citri CBS 116435]|uniref:DNA glycosylase n=1 Tax=Polychaeton citri CBS 116435 TaxID=1314669 RepID=A0A9P4QCN9_9PEZI|nr:DNA glycosylase [Polychaeton citri CBS 116435]
MARQTRSAAAAAKAAQESNYTAATTRKSKKDTSTVTSSKQTSKSQQPSTPARANIGRKRTRGSTLKEEEDEDTYSNGEEDGEVEAPSKDRATKRARKSAESEDVDVKVKEEAIEENASPVKTPVKKKKAEKYSEGVSPYPNWPNPTPEMCREVIRLLEKLHGKADPPKEIPPPSLDRAGCGDVPAVLDAIVRTRLSANTTNKNSATAFRGLVERFGVLKEGVGKGSVDWNAVRVARNEDVLEAIKHGGLAKTKSKDIQAILQIAYDENQTRKSQLEDPDSKAAGEATEPADAKDMEIANASQEVISLDQYHLLPTWDAMRKMTEFPGIGWKTAACVAMFCMQRPVFAVDTHVFRLCQYLGWIPKSTKKGEPKIDRDTCFFHCDAMIPDDCKYALHQLLIRHGKACPRCRAVTGQSSRDWETGCVIEHLVTRHGAKKGGSSAKDREKARLAAGLDEDAKEAGDEHKAKTNRLVKERHGEVDGKDDDAKAESEQGESSDLSEAESE